MAFLMNMDQWRVCSLESPEQLPHRAVLSNSSPRCKFPKLLTFISRHILKGNTHPVLDILPKLISLLIKVTLYFKSSHYSNRNQNPANPTLLQFSILLYPCSPASLQVSWNPSQPKGAVDIFSWSIFLQNTSEQLMGHSSKFWWRLMVEGNKNTGNKLGGFPLNIFLQSQNKWKRKRVSIMCQP